VLDRSAGCAPVLITIGALCILIISIDEFLV
jgi:hypothetical protein